jgi:two-component system, NtrC family, sensor kinase
MSHAVPSSRPEPRGGGTAGVRRSTVRISIRYQIVALVAGILIAAMLTYLGLTRSLFTSDKLAWLYDYNSLLAGTLSEEVGAYLKTLGDKLRYFGIEQSDHLAVEEPDKHHRVRALFGSREDLLALELWIRDEEGTYQKRYQYVDGARLEALAIVERDLAEAARQVPLSLEAAAAEGQLVENVSLPPDLALLRASSAADEGRIVVVSYLQPDRLLRLFGRSELHRAWLVDGRGRVVVHPDPELVLTRADQSSLPIVRSALEGKLSRGAEEFVARGEAWLGAFARVPVSRLAVMIEVPRREAFRATTELNRRTLLFGVGVIASALLASIYFSRRLSAPLRKLEETMEVVSRGDLGVEVPVTNNNEIGRLAEAFNRMSRELSAREALLMERNAQLVQSEKLSALGELSAGLAHEVKNPMVGIVGFAQLGVTSTNLQEAREYFGLIEGDAKRANEILQNLLEFARPMKVEMRTLEPNAVVQGAVRLVAHQLQISRVRLETHYSSGLPLIRGNDNQLQQVLVNLLMNAAHAMEDAESKRLYVKTSFAQSGGVLIEVRDTGHGMASEVQARIFQPFFTTKERGKGTGLGLSVSRSIINEHRGEIRVESVPGQGATFVIFLPPEEATAEPMSDGLKGSVALADAHGRSN